MQYHESVTEDFAATTAKQHLFELNPPQLEAVKHFKGPILVLAGAGSGKTRVLTRRVANLVLSHGVAPYAILAVTFTNKATEEMRSRLTSMLGGRARYLWVATFHSACLRILRQHASLLGYSNDFVVYDEQDSRNVLKDTFKQLSINDRQATVPEVARIIDQAKNAYIQPQDLPHHFSSDTYEVDPCSALYQEIYSAYQKQLLASNAMDFGDLLFNAVRLFDTQPQVLERYRQQIKFLLVDEFQDTNLVQYNFIKLLSAPANNLLVVGDDDQSIYAFRGATVRNILDFEKDFVGAKTVKLEQNYRSSNNILKAANAVIEKNRSRKEKKLWTDSGAGEQLKAFAGHDESDEAKFVAQGIKEKLANGTLPRDIAVFYRVNAQSRAIEEALLHAEIPYRIYGGLKFYDRKEIKDIVAYLRLLVNDLDTQAFLRVVNNPPRGIGARTIKTILETARERKGSYLAAARKVALKNKHVEKFVALIDGLRSEVGRVSLAKLISETVKRSDYLKSANMERDPAAQSRTENLLELEAIARTLENDIEKETDALRAFLDRISLASGQELPVEENRDKSQSGDKESVPNVVSLMTLHLAKGLEYDVVFLIGLEEGLLPHYRSIEENSIDEERRLCYVGMTRARKELYLTRCHMRGMFMSGGGFAGAGHYRSVSRFMYDVPSEVMELVSQDFLSDEASDEDEIVFEEDDEFKEFESRQKTFGKSSRIERLRKKFLSDVLTADEIAGKNDE